MGQTTSSQLVGSVTLRATDENALNHLNNLKHM